MYGADDIGDAVRAEDGQTLVEYALILALIALALVGVLSVLAGGIDAVFDYIHDSWPAL